MSGHIFIEEEEWVGWKENTSGPTPSSGLGEELPGGNSQSYLREHETEDGRRAKVTIREIHLDREAERWLVVAMDVGTRSLCYLWKGMRSLLRGLGSTNGIVGSRKRSCITDQ